EIRDVLACRARSSVGDVRAPCAARPTSAYERDARFCELFHGATKLAERLARGVIAVWDCREDIGGTTDESRDEIAFRARVDRHVEEHDWHLGPSHTSGATRFRRNLKQGVAIVDRRAVEVPFAPRP